MFAPAQQGIPRYSRWPLVVWGVAAVVGMVPAAEGTVISWLKVAAWMVCALCGVTLAAEGEQRLWVRLGRRSPAVRVVATAAVPLVAFPAGLLVALVGASLVQPVGLDGGWLATGLAWTFWFPAAAVGSLSVRIIDGAVSHVTNSFRTRIVLAVFLLLALVGSLAVLMATRIGGFVKRNDGFEITSDSDVNIGATFREFLNDNQQDVVITLVVIGILFCIPAVMSAAAKLGDAVMERIHPLVEAMTAVAGGERNVRLEEGGSKELREVARHFNGMMEALGLAERMERAFGAYVSPEIMRRIKAQHGSADLPPGLRVASVLFSDIRGFTTLSERLSPSEVVAVLNRYLSAMVSVVNEHEGYLDKFMGDAVVAVFNGPVDQPDHAQRAIRCGVAMQRVLREMNAAGAFDGHGPLKMGIGVATGPLVCGNIGSQHKLQFTVIGDTVNLASRIEGMTKQYGAGLLVSQATAEALPDGLTARQVDKVTAKGKDQPVIIVEVLDALDAQTAQARKETLTDFQDARAQLDGQHAAAAIALLEGCVSRDGSDLAAHKHLERAKEYDANGFPPQWDGVVRLTAK